MEFRPERWLESPGEKTETPLGVYGNLCVCCLLNRADKETRLICLFQCQAHFLRGRARLYRLEVCVSRRISPPSIQIGMLIQPHPSLAEIQAFLVTLVREFDFSIPEGRNIRTARPGILVPIVIGEEDKGPQLPLKITPVRGI